MSIFDDFAIGANAVPFKSPGMPATWPKPAPAAAPTAAPNDPFIIPRGEDVKPYAGLPEGYRDQLLSFVMPQVQTTIGDMGGYGNEFNRFLKEEMPKYIGNLANRGILSSSVAENTLSQALSGGAERAAAFRNQQAQQNLTTLTGLINSTRYQEDPTVLYRTMADLLARI